MKKTILLFLAFCCLTVQAQYIQRTASFDFANPKSFGFTPSTSNGGAETLLGVTLTDGNIKTSFGRTSQNDTPPTIYTYINSTKNVTEYYMRMQSGSTVTFSATGSCTITNITFEINGLIGNYGNLALLAGEPGTFSEGVWTAGSTAPASVTFRCGNNMARISKVIINYQESSVTLSPSSVIPADGTKDLKSFTSMSLTFASPMTAQRASESIMLTGQYANGTSYSKAPEITGNGSNVITLSVDKIAMDGTFTMTIPAQSFKDGAGYENRALSYSFSIRVPFDTLRVNPVNNSEIYSLDFPIRLTFPNETEGERVGKVDTEKVFELKREGVELPIAIVKAVRGEDGNVLLKTRGDEGVLDDEKSFTTPGTYTLEVAEKTVYDYLYDTPNEHYNSPILLTYKVVEKPDELKGKKDSVAMFKEEVANNIALLNTVGYPKVDDATNPLAAANKIEVSENVTEEELVAAIAKLQAALKAFYDATDILLPEAGEWYTIASVNKAGQELPLSYTNGAVTLGGKAAAFQVESITDGVAVLKTSDGMYLHVLMDIANTSPTSSKNVTSEYLEAVNKLSLAKLTIGTLGTDDQKPYAGLLTISGSLGIDNSTLVNLGTATALIDHSTGKIVTSANDATLYFEDGKTSAFRFVKTEEPKEEVFPVATFDGAVVDSNEKMLTLVIQGRDNIGDVSKVKLNPANSPYFTHVVDNETKIASHSANPILEEMEGETNKFIVHLTGLASGMYKLVLPANTFDYTENPKKVTDIMLNASFTISSGSGEGQGEGTDPTPTPTPTPTPIDDYSQFGTLPEVLGTLPKVFQAVATTDQDIRELILYFVGYNIYPNKDANKNTFKIVETASTLDIVYGTGHFEVTEIPGSTHNGVKLVYDQEPTWPMAAKTYSFVIPKGALGDDKFNKYQNGDTSIKPSDCLVNDAFSFIVTIDNDAAADNENKEAFTNYKTEQKAVVDGKVQEGDSDECKALIRAANTAISELSYDTSKTLAENKARVDAIISKLDTDLAAQRAKDAVNTEFATYKSEQKTAADGKAQEDDSEECKALITAAKAAIDALAFDKAKSLAENKALVDAIISKLDADLTTQRSYDASKAALSKSVADATAYYESIKESHAAIASLLGNAIDSAKAKLNDTTSTQSDMDTAKQTLDAALNAAKELVATGITTISADDDAFSGANIFTIDGRKLDGKPTKKGVYIVNGRKVVIK